jgi:hypothetical protein
LPSSPLHDYRTAEYRAEIAARLKLMGGG